MLQKIILVSLCRYHNNNIFFDLFPSNEWNIEASFLMPLFEARSSLRVKFRELSNATVVESKDIKSGKNLIIYIWHTTEHPLDIKKKKENFQRQHTNRVIILFNREKW